MSDATTYEVQVRKNGQWEVFGGFRGSQQKNEAIEAAKEQDRKPGVEAVKVFEESLDPETGVFNETVVFKTVPRPTAKPDTPKAGGGVARGAKAGGDMARGGKAGANAPEDGEKPKKDRRLTLTGVAVRLVVVVVVSVCVASIAAVSASDILGGTILFGNRVVGDVKFNLVISVFAGSFVITLSLLFFFFLRGIQLKPSKRSKPFKESRINTFMMKWWDRQFKRLGWIGAKGRAKRRTAAIQASAELHAAADAAFAGDEDEIEDTPGEDTPEEEAPAPNAEEPLSPQAEKRKAYMIDFLTTSLEGCGADKDKMDNFNKFGVSMFMAGAAEILTQGSDLDESDHARILADGFRSMGFRKSHADNFANSYEGYLMADSRYMQMFQAGRNAINTFIADETTGPKLLEEALAEWNEPKKREMNSGPVTVLFTDIAGSTAMTQALGDAGAQKVVRVHNKIVRHSLTSCAGKEVKHTGDGIMASFAKATNGIKAAIQMQRKVALHNQEKPDLPLHLKIGLNAGEPIAEDNDLFGSTVQMSARIVDKAQADEIFVSDVMRGLCAGKDFEFVNRGGYSMKGFDDDPILYEVVWDDAAGAP